MTAPTIETDLAGLKRLGKELLDALPGASVAEIEGGWACFSLAFLGASLPRPTDEVQATALYSILAKRVTSALFALETTR